MRFDRSFQLFTQKMTNVRLLFIALVWTLLIRVLLIQNFINLNTRLWAPILIRYFCVH